MTEWETSRDLYGYDRRVIQTPKGATKEGRADQHLLEIDDDDSKFLDLDEPEELERPNLYSFADLKAFKIVKNTDEHDSDFSDSSDTMTDEEEENDFMDLRIPIKKATSKRGQRQVRFKDESPLADLTPTATPHAHLRTE